MHLITKQRLVPFDDCFCKNYLKSRVIQFPGVKSYPLSPFSEEHLMGCYIVKLYKYNMMN